MAVFKNIIDILRIFLGNIDSKEIPKKGSITAIGGVIYYFAEYLLMVIAAAIVGFLRYYEWSVLEIFLILWPGNILVSYLIVRANDGSGVDFTFFQGYSRLTMQLPWENMALKILGIIAAIPIVGFTIFWQGAGPMVIFLKTRGHFKKEILGIILLAVSGLQMGIWTWLYVLGYESISDLIYGLR